MTTLTNVEQLKRDIEDKQGEIATIQSSIENFEFSCTEEQFNAFLDDVEQSVTICGVEFYPSDILKSCDPVAYRCSKADYESNYDLDNVEEYADLKDSLEALEAELEDLESELEDLNDQIDG